MQSQVELMQKNLKIWSSHSLILEVQTITYIIYQSIMGMLTYLHSISLKM